MRIGEFARQAGVSPRSLRHYEEAGLLVPERTSAGYRDYRPEDLDVVARIRPILATGLGESLAAKVFGFLAAMLAAVNIFGGFIVTRRMLAMFQSKKRG